MDILGIGPLEIFFILLIALIVLGPNDMVKAGRTIGKFLRRIITSSDWRTIQQASRDIRYLPNRLMREAGLEDIEEEVKRDLPDDATLRKQIGVDELRDEMKNWQDDMTDWTTPPPTIGTPESPPDQVETEGNEAVDSESSLGSPSDEASNDQSEPQSETSPDNLEQSETK